MSRGPFPWNSFWGALGALGTLAGFVWGIYVWAESRKRVEASVSVVNVQRAQDKDADGYVAFIVNCLLSNNGNVAFSVSHVEPYTFGPQVPDKSLTKPGTNSLSKTVVQADGGKQEPFQITAYFYKDFLEQGRRQQLPVSAMAPPWTPAAAVLVKIKFEGRAGDGTYWTAAAPQQRFAFTSGIPKVVNPVDLTAALFTKVESTPAHKNLFR